LATLSKPLGDIGGTCRPIDRYV